MSSRPTEGETRTYERTFTKGDVEAFADVFRDTQPRHTEPDADGRLLVHGLLTATLPTKIGGDLRVLAESMTFEFRHPVYTGEPVTCTWTFSTVEARPERFDVSVEVRCENDAGDIVLSGVLDGRIAKST
ncbi:dehydratase [Halorubellus sp. JP-L1]|uniref:dehydratase n=1 Tax=Halorubellus sp. JP-L1 TaxID=2715753 RepID=UPI00140A462A|nr:dehydratase [Halorubellus sp. JP-L1]NHN40638.1 dehydratase [Halorubellus sp. JP-L1]